MKKTKSKVLASIIALSMTALLAVGCGTGANGGKEQNVMPTNQPDTSSATEQPTNQETDKTYNIGILQIIEHDALDQSRLGFLDGLKEAGFEEGKNIVVNYQNAQGDQSNLKTMSQLLVQQKSDLILAIATPSAQSIAMETKEIPILVTAVTDPQKSGIVETNEKPGANVSGTSDLTPIEKQFELIKKVLPNTKKVGIIYNSSEKNSEIQADIAVEAAKKLGFAYEVATIASPNDIAQVTEMLISKVDVLYVPTDNVLAASYPLISKIANEKKIPFVGAEEGAVDNGALFTDGLSYYNLGKQTAQMAVRILKDGESPADMPIEYLENTNIAINLKTAKEIGIELPAEIVQQAAKVVE